MNNTKYHQRPCGHLDGLIQGFVCGWAWNPFKPNEAVDVDLYINDQLYAKVRADQFRKDLLDSGLGNGVHSFRVPIEATNLDAVYLISARLSETGSEILNSPMSINSPQKQISNADLSSLKVDPLNIDSTLERLNSAKIGHLLIDFNDTCNADCVYCPNLRSKKRIELEQFKILLTKCSEIDTLQFGCGQEPTADMRLSDFYRTLHNSELHPKRLVMITNGTLLHKHDVRLFRDCGLKELQISLDTADPEINAMTRQGTNIERIVNNLQDFRQKCPEVILGFSAVIHSLTINGVEALLDLGESLGVGYYYLREVFNHHPSNLPTRNNDYQDWIKKITLKPGEFRRMQEKLNQHPAVKKINFIPANILDSNAQERVESWKKLQFVSGLTNN